MGGALHHHRRFNWVLLSILCAACGGSVEGGTPATGGNGRVPSVCDDNPCQNDGQCVEDVASFRCECAPGFTGDTCGALVVGLAERPSNPTCVAPERAPGSTGALAWEQVPWFGAGSGLMQTRQAPDGSWYEIFRGGDVFRVSAAGVREENSLLTIPNISTSGELGLLGVDLHPDYPAEPYIFFYYATNPDAPFLRIQRYTTTALTDTPGTETFGPGSEKDILTIDKGTTARNHNGGYIEFSPIESGAVLYLATGDGGGNRMTAQDPASLLG